MGQICADRIGAMTAHHHASHATLLQRFNGLTEERVLVLVVRFNDDDATDVLLPNGVNRLKHDEVFFA